MKILMVGPHPEKVKGGMSTVIKSYYDSELVNRNKIIAINTVVDGIKIKKLLILIGSYIRMFGVLITQKIDIVHIHLASRKSFYRKSLYINLASIFKKRIIVHMHGGEFDDFYKNESNKWQQKYITKTFNKASIILALGEEWKKKINQYTNTPVEILYNSVNVSKENLYSDECKNILFLGRIEKEKGVYDLLNAMKVVQRFDKESKLILAGDGEVEKIKKVIKTLNLTENIVLTGWINSKDVRELLLKTSIFVLPSYNEGLPMSILEAMALGIPVISTNVGSIPELVENDVNGKIILPGEVKELSDALIELIKDKEKRKQISDMNFYKIKKSFSNEVNHEKLNLIYNSLLKGEYDR